MSCLRQVMVASREWGPARCARAFFGVARAPDIGSRPASQATSNAAEAASEACSLGSMGTANKVRTVLFCPKAKCELRSTGFAKLFWRIKSSSIVSYSLIH